MASTSAALASKTVPTATRLSWGDEMALPSPLPSVGLAVQLRLSMSRSSKESSITSLQDWSVKAPTVVPEAFSGIS